MKIDTAYTAHLGGRDEQQDAVTVLDRPDRSAYLVVLADGMGGHAGGSLASRTVVETAERVWRETDAVPDPRELLARICQTAHDAINAAGAEQNLSPRSTCVLLYLSGGSAHWAHVGDSRLYRFRDGKQLDRTRDHSVVQMLLDMGKISEAEMGTHPDQNRLTQSLGGDNDPEPDFGADEARSGDSFVLCSDGLWEMVTPEEMAGALAQKGLDRQPDALAATAFERAGRHSDNISVAMIRLGDAKGAAAAAETPSEAPTRPIAPEDVARAAVAGGAARAAGGGGRMALAFLVVGLLAVGAAAAVVRPWEEPEPLSATRPKDAAIAPAPTPLPAQRHKLRPLPGDRRSTRDAEPGAKKDASRPPASRPGTKAARPASPNTKPGASRPAPNDGAPTARTGPDAAKRPSTTTPAKRPSTTAPAKRPSTTAPAKRPSTATPAKPGSADTSRRPDAVPEVIRPGKSRPKTGPRQSTDPSSKAE